VKTVHRCSNDVATRTPNRLDELVSQRRLSRSVDAVDRHTRWMIQLYRDNGRGKFVKAGSSCHGCMKSYNAAVQRPRAAV
jgi:hypothetical protein